MDTVGPAGELGVGPVVLVRVCLELWELQEDIRQRPLRFLAVRVVPHEDAAVLLLHGIGTQLEATVGSVGLVRDIGVVAVRTPAPAVERTFDAVADHGAAVTDVGTEVLAVRLQQVQQLLPVSRASLFLAGVKPLQVQWVSGRDATGQAESQLRASEQELALAVLNRRRTLTGRAEASLLPSGKSGPGPRLMGVPLRAQEQLLGILCVELTAGTEALRGDDGEVLEWLCNQLALSLMTARAQKMEASASLDRRRLAAQGALLSAAARLARGDLDSPIPASTDRELLSLSQALESMRKDLQSKFETLRKYSGEMSERNEELRRQIDQRSRRVLDVALTLDSQKAGQKAH